MWSCGRTNLEVIFSPIYIHFVITRTPYRIDTGHFWFPLYGRISTYQCKCLTKQIYNFFDQTWFWLCVYKITLYLYITEIIQRYAEIQKVYQLGFIIDYLTKTNWRTKWLIIIMGEDYLHRIYYRVIYSCVTSQHSNRNLQLNLKYRTQLVLIDSTKNITEWKEHQRCDGVF